MKKNSKRSLLVIMVLIITVAMCACSDKSNNKEDSGDTGNAPVEKQKDEGVSESNSPEETNDATETKDNNIVTGKTNFKTSKKGKVRILESGYNFKDDSIEVGALLGNENSEKAYTDFGMTITAFAEDGSILGTEDATQFTIQPGEIRPFCASIYTKGKKPKKVEVEVIEGEEAEAESEAIKTSDLVVSNVSKTEDKEMGNISFTGQVKNNSKKDAEEAVIVVLLKNKGKIVGAGEDYIDVKSQKKKAFDFETDSVKYDDYEIYVYSDYVSI